jgi:glutamyl-tRNA synthetase
METVKEKVVKGRFAPSPTGRMHLGNVFAALVSWLSVKSRGGKWILRIEDLDPQRSRLDYARQVEDDLQWLGLDWDEGGLDNKEGIDNGGIDIGGIDSGGIDSGGIDNKAANGPYRQSLRGDIYEEALHKLEATGLTYPCFCTRADIMATQAPHESDGRVVYAGTCRPPLPYQPDMSKVRATRLIVPDRTILFTDRLYGPQSVNLARHCGDFVLRRADGAWAYQLAVVVDDALMGVTEVVRGNDLLLSSAQQIYLYTLLGYDVPEFAHIPLMCNSAGQRLSKRDQSLSMETLRKEYTPSQLIGQIAWMAGLLPEPFPISAEGLLPLFSWSVLPKERIIID